MLGFGPIADEPIAAGPAGRSASLQHPIPAAQTLLKVLSESLAHAEGTVFPYPSTTGAAELYSSTRQLLMGYPSVSDRLPSPIRENESLESALFQLLLERRKPQEIKSDLERTFYDALMLGLAQDGAESGRARTSVTGEPVNAGQWTGIPGRSGRLIAVKAELSVAAAAIDQLLGDLESSFGGNCGPLFDEHQQAIDDLRRLHDMLGKVLKAIDEGRYNDDLGDALILHIGRFGPRVLDAVKSDPARFLSAGLIMAVFSACGLAEWGGLQGGVAVSISKPSRGKTGQR